jgi:simple sugar transport system ATP-binding protein
MSGAAVAAADGDGQVSTDLPVADATGITKRYGSTVALDNAHITVRPGQTHALVGRNGAGKSTMVAILTGLQAADEGTVHFGGEPAPPLSDRGAWRSRVACVYQKSTIIPQLSVAENLFLNRYGTGSGGLIRWTDLRRRAQELLDAWSVDVDPSVPAGELAVAQRQFVEIARALSLGTRFIILDEPTAQLDAPAIERLFARMRELRAQGVTFLFISHHLQEVYDICDTVTVFRDARHVTTAPVADLSRADLVAAMTGELPRARAESVAGRPGERGGAVLTVSGLTLSPSYVDVDLRVGTGEIVGLAGGGSSGKAELAETLVGLRRADRGTVDVAGTRPRPGDVGAALAAGVAFVPEDRHRQGFVAGMSIGDNVTMTVPRRLGRWGFVHRGRRADLAGQTIRELAIKTAGPDEPVSALSGGNQQKVVVGRALASRPRLLVLITPTAGVDVRSKESLLDTLVRVAAGGTGVVLATDELDDLRICDRVLVLFHGRARAEFARGWSDNDLVAAMEGLGLDG